MTTPATPPPPAPVPPEGMRLFTKKPISVPAIQWSGENWPTIHAINAPISGPFQDYERTGEAKPYLYLLINTLEGDMRADPGDWIIRGVKGEFYPCKPDIFEATYDDATRAPLPAEPELLYSEDFRVGKCAQCSRGLHREFARPKYIEGVLRSVCPICAEKAITHKCRGRVSHYYSAGDAIPMFCVDCGAEVVVLPAEQQVSQIADAREGQVASRVIPDSLKIGAPQHEQAGESLPSATIEPTSSESSGDVHLARALAEIERLKTTLASADREIERLNIMVSALGSTDTEVTLRAKALAQEGENKRLREGISTATDLVKNLIHSEGCGFVLGMDENEKYCVVSPCTCGKQAAFDVLSAALATPSPAPVVKTNPPAISSPLVDAGEKDSAGPTPIRMNAVKGGGYDVWIGDKYANEVSAELAHAITNMQRELTTSESLRQKYAQAIENAEHAVGCRFTQVRTGLPCRCFKSALTPPVAGEGGEG